MLRICLLLLALTCPVLTRPAPVAGDQPDMIAVALRVQMRETVTDRTVEELLRRELNALDRIEVVPQSRKVDYTISVLGMPASTLTGRRMGYVITTGVFRGCMTGATYADVFPITRSIAQEADSTLRMHANSELVNFLLSCRTQVDRDLMVLGSDPEWLSTVVGWIDEWELELF